MSNDELKARYDQLVKAVKYLRTYQVKYYKYRAIQDKNNMVRYQRLVDDLLKEDVKDRQDVQLKML